MIAKPDTKYPYIVYSTVRTILSSDAICSLVAELFNLYYSITYISALLDYILFTTCLYVSMELFELIFQLFPAEP